MRVLFTFSLPATPTSWNTLARKSHWKYTPIFEYWKSLTFAMANQLKPVKPYDIPVRLIFEAEWKGKRKHDIDNLLVKPIVDKLKEMGFFVDDDTSRVPEIVLRGKTHCEKNQIIVTAVAYV